MKTWGLSEAQVDAEGIVHNAFIEAWVRWSTIENPRAWLFTVVRRMVRRQADKALRCSSLGDDLDATRPVRWASLAPQPTLDDMYHAREVVVAIAGLPNHERVAICLSQMQG